VQVTALHVADEKCDVEVVTLLLAHDGVTVNHAKNDGATPLLMAAYSGHAKKVQMIS
jgi:ankyrin repeat protein